MAVDSIQARCPHCNSLLSVPKSAIGQSIQCDKCRATLHTSRKAKSVPQDRPLAKPVDAEPAPFDAASALSGLAVTAHARRRVRARSSKGWLFAVIMLSLGGLACAVAYVNRDRLGSLLNDATAISAVPRNDTPPEKHNITTPPKAEVAYPRRFLAISINNYLYANPIRVGAPARSISALLERLGDRWSIPRDQRFLLTDAPNSRGAVPPLKSVITNTIEQFAKTSRPQDHIVLFFAGHAVVIDGKSFLVPIEGELKTPESLLPLDWLWSTLATCPARQKLVILDVARLDPGRGAERPAPTPMAPELEASLKTPPPGVQVWSACSAKQPSFEFEYQLHDGFEVRGGLFVNQLFHALQQGLADDSPEKPFPLDNLAAKVRDFTQSFAQAVQDQPQSPFTAGIAPGPASGLDLSATPAPRVVITKPSELLPGGQTDPKTIREIFAEIRMPPVKVVAANEGSGESTEASLPFAAAALQGYSADYGNIQEILDKPEQFPLRVAVLNAVETLQRHGQGEVMIGTARRKVGLLREDLFGPINDDVKKTIAKEQAEGPAVMYVELETLLNRLEKLQPKREDESSKRWQAHFDYVLAMVKSRFAYINEYNFALGKIRKDELPPLDPKLHKGWRLASQEKLQSPREVKDQADDARKLFEKLIKERPGTPWEVLAKRERQNALGLIWQPIGAK